MFIKLPFIFFLLITYSIGAQVTFVIDKLPKNTPTNSSIYISGDFEGWSGGQEKYRLNQKNNQYFITLPKQKEHLIHFKFTRGSWETVETDLEGNDINNRNYSFDTNKDTVNLIIQNWSHQVLKKSTATKNVSILSKNLYIPQLNRKRRIWIYLPPNYENSKKSYSVLYMHDGQNLFDNITSYAGEWKIDETLNSIFNETGNGFIVVGIDNGAKKRLDEYSPWKNEQYGGGEGDAYINFISHTLKPYIDKKFKTLPNKENTIIFGSSMGGLISFYAALKYPNIYGKIGVFSPSFWFSKSIVDFTKKNSKIKDTKMFFLAGDQEGENTVNEMEQIIELMKNNGFPKKNISKKIIPNGQHNEALWRDNFKEAILWLFEK